MSGLFVDIGQFASHVLQLLIGIPLWVIMAILIVSVCTATFGPVGMVLAIILILNYSRR